MEEILHHAHISIASFHLFFSRIGCRIACTTSRPSFPPTSPVSCRFFIQFCARKSVLTTLSNSAEQIFFNSWSRIYSHLVEPEGSVPYSENRILIVCQMNPEYSFPVCLKSILILFSHLRLPNGNLLSEFRTKLPYKFLVSPVHITWLTNFIFLT